MLEYRHIAAFIAICYLLWIVLGLINGTTPLFGVELKTNVLDGSRATLTWQGYLLISIWLVAPHIYFFIEYFQIEHDTIARNWQVLSKDIWLGATGIILLIKDLAIKTS